MQNQFKNANFTLEMDFLIKLYFLYDFYSQIFSKRCIYITYLTKNLEKCLKIWKMGLKTADSWANDLGPGGTCLFLLSKWRWSKNACFNYSSAVLTGYKILSPRNATKHDRLFFSSSFPLYVQPALILA